MIKHTITLPTVRLTVSNDVDQSEILDAALEAMTQFRDALASELDIDRFRITFEDLSTMVELNAR